MNTNNPTLIARSTREFLVDIRSIARNILATHRHEEGMSRTIAEIEACIIGAMHGTNAMLQVALPKDSE